jgi:hypothetical protein
LSNCQPIWFCSATDAVIFCDLIVQVVMFQ